MSYITYTAKRELISGHSSGTDYTITIYPRVVDRSNKTFKSENVSLSGVTETIRYRKESYIDVTAIKIDEADLPQWREFFHSVDAGESFTIELTSDSPETPLSVTLDSDSFTETRMSTFSTTFQVSFRVKL